MKYFEALKMQSVSQNKMLLSVFFMSVFDFILTFCGINILCCIEEANPIMIASFNCGFGKGIILRFMQIGIPIVTLFVLKNKVEAGFLNKSILVVFYVEIGVMAMHMWWITKYLLII